MIVYRKSLFKSSSMSSLEIVQLIERGLSHCKRCPESSATCSRILMSATTRYFLGLMDKGARLFIGMQRSEKRDAE